MLRRIVEHEVTPEEAVRARHGVLQSTGIPPLRKLDDDLQLTSGITSYGGTGSTIVKPAGSPARFKPDAVKPDTTPATPPRALASRRNLHGCGSGLANSLPCGQPEVLARIASCPRVSGSLAFLLLPADVISTHQVASRAEGPV